MSDTLSSSAPDKSLSNQAKELEERGQFLEALDLYNQLYTQQPGNGFAASGCLRCLRRLHRAEEAVLFGKKLPTTLLYTNPYIQGAFAWAIYDHYFKKSEEEHEEDLVE